MKKFHLIFFLIFGFSLIGYSQNQGINNRIYYETNQYIGKLIPMYNDFPDYRLSYLSELKIGVQTFGKKNWHRSYGFPYTGVSLIYGRFGNQNVFGNSLAVVPNMTFRTKFSPKFTFGFTIGFGLAGFDKPNSIENNPRNLLIGSHLTYLAYAGFFYKKNIRQNLILKTGIQLMHYSNSHYKLPNVGVNLPLAFVGLTYFPNSEMPDRVGEGKITKRDGWRINLRVGGGIHENGIATGPIGGPKYRVYSSYLYVSKRLGKFSQLSIGISGKYYEKNFEYINARSIYKENRRHLNSSIGALFVGHEFVMGHFAFWTSGGLKLFNVFENQYNSWRPHVISFSNKLKTHLSTKIGVQFYLFEPESRAWNIFIGDYISANFSQADFPEVCIGFVFN